MKNSFFLLLAAVASACASARPAVPEIRRITAIKPCSASVMVRLGDQSDATVPIRSATLLATVPDTPRAAYRTYEIPARVTAFWYDTLFVSGTGEQSRSQAPHIRAWSATARDVRYDLPYRTMYLRCGEDRTEVIALPVTRTVAITSDPAGASIFIRVPTGSYSSEEKFLGVTPLNADIAFERDAQFKNIRLEKSGYHAVDKQVRRTDSTVRVIMHPLPAHGDKPASACRKTTATARCGPG